MEPRFPVFFGKDEGRLRAVNPEPAIPARRWFLFRPSDPSLQVVGWLRGEAVWGKGCWGALRGTSSPSPPAPCRGHRHKPTSPIHVLCLRRGKRTSLPEKSPGNWQSTSAGRAAAMSSVIVPSLGWWQRPGRFWSCSRSPSEQLRAQPRARNLLSEDEECQKLGTRGSMIRAAPTLPLPSACGPRWPWAP